MNWIWTIIAALTVQSVAGDEQTHRVSTASSVGSFSSLILFVKYKEGDDVVLWMNTVGPRANRQETYEYYQLPYCSGSKALNYHRETLGEALQGMNLVNSGLEIQFRGTVHTLEGYLLTLQFHGPRGRLVQSRLPCRRSRSSCFDMQCPTTTSSPHTSMTCP
eukprot:Partr_v1_DN26971_c0_g1_i3_m7329 putative transmembrane 9 superfamily member